MGRKYSARQALRGNPHFAKGPDSLNPPESEEHRLFALFDGAFYYEYALHLSIGMIFRQLPYVRELEGDLLRGREVSIQ